MDFKDEKTLSRRTFVKGSLASLALAGAAGSTALYGCTPSDEKKAETAEVAESADEIVWSQCNVNCGGNCVFQWHTRDGKILYMESDNIGETDLQARACLRGRSMRRWISSPDRLLYPMKRVGNRGEGKFEQISWDEAIDTIADRIKYTIETYGNDAIHIVAATGMFATMGNPSMRLFNCLGGSLGKMYNYSSNMTSAVMPYMYGKNFVAGGKGSASSFSEAARASDLVVLFGDSPSDTRMGGANATWDFARVREGVKKRGGKIINIDCRLNETSAGQLSEWLPIRPGTDAALASAIAHEFIANEQIDLDFLHTYCIGYDEETLPESAKGQNRSYKDYIMGTGYDMVEKTPEWAAPITQISASTIRELASTIASAEAPFIAQGYGPQRHTNGEDATRAICMIPILIGKIGLPGTNTGQREIGAWKNYIGTFPAGENPVKAMIPCFQWLNAIDHGKEMTATNAGVKGVDALQNDIKLIWNYAGNTLTNQHGDINHAHDILADESKCEFIVVWDTVLTDSAKYADILLPDAMRSEQLNMHTQGYAEYYAGVIVGGPAQEAPGDCRSSYDVMAQIADRFGVKDRFTEGRTHDEWAQFIYEEGVAANPELPSWEEIKAQGIYKQPLEPVIGFEAFRNDPEKNPLETPSGKIEIYSDDLAHLAETWEFEEGETISPIPVFTPGFQGYGSTNNEYPLHCCGFHHKGSTHSSFAFIPEIKQAARHRMWINPIDASERSIEDGDVCLVESPAGTVRIEAFVTSRVIPGTVCVPQGSWHDANMNGDRVDSGGCINTLTTYHPTPLGKGNGPSHSIIVQVAKA